MRATPEEFRAVARRLRAERHRIDVDVGRLRSAQVFFRQWRSPASSLFSSGYYEGSLETMRLPVRDLDGLASALERAADQLEAAVRRDRQVERDAYSWFNSQPAPEDGSSPVWERQWWRYRPGRFPSSGDSEWFAVQRYLRRLGVWV